MHAPGGQRAISGHGNDTRRLAGERDMRELDIHVPMTRQDGNAVSESVMDAIRVSLTNAFGGFTHLRPPIEGVWQVGETTIRDAVTIFRVLDMGDGTFDVAAFKRSLARLLEQEDVLIVAREVTVVEG